MRVLVACEYSGVVRDAFIAKGREAMSCDILPTEQEGPHYQGNVLDVLNDGWDLMIAHPPCTYFSRAAGIVLYNPTRLIKTRESFEFVKALWNTPIDRVCLENPVGWLNTNWRKPNQTIHPWYFGDGEMKETCLWLKNLPKLSGKLEIAMNPRKYHPLPAGSRIGSDGKIKNRYFMSRVTNAKDRAKTFPGIATAMAEQWNY